MSARTLLLDLGNTRLKWKFLNDPQCFALTHSEDSACWAPLFAATKPDRVVLASVQGARANALEAETIAQWGMGVERVQTPAHFAWASSLTWRNAYSDFSKLGVDRFLAMIAAINSYPDQRLLVAVAGTALTVDVIDEAGAHQGGLILPGPKLMRASLHQNTAALPIFDEVYVAPSGLGSSTQQAIYLASVRAGGALINELAAQHMPILCVLSGGASAEIAPFVRHTCVIFHDVVLSGLDLWCAI